MLIASLSALFKVLVLAGDWGEWLCQSKRYQPDWTHHRHFLDNHPQNYLVKIFEVTNNPNIDSRLSDSQSCCSLMVFRLDDWCS